MKYEVKTYVKNPVEVEAVQFTDENKQQVLNWAKSIQMNVQHSWDDDNNPILLIPTKEGEMACSLNDYIIVEPFPTDWRKLYPCKEDIFLKTYREKKGVEEQTMPFIVSFTTDPHGEQKPEEKIVHLPCGRSIYNIANPELLQSIRKVLLEDIGYPPFMMVTNIRIGVPGPIY